jgi:ankyrin repeat protein
MWQGRIYAMRATHLKALAAVGLRAVLGPVVILVTAAGMMVIRFMAEPSTAAAMKANSLFEAARVGDVAAIKRAVEDDGMPIDLVETGSGMTPLMRAVSGRQPAAVEWLLAHGADINAKAPGHGTPLGIAATDPDAAPMVSLLLEHGADPDGCAAEGRTPLIQAAMWGNAKAAAMLLRAGARPDARDRCRNTAASIAREYGNDEIVRMLESAPIADGGDGTAPAGIRSW